MTCHMQTDKDKLFHSKMFFRQKERKSQGQAVFIIGPNEGYKMSPDRLSYF